MCVCVLRIDLQGGRLPSFCLCLKLPWQREGRNGAGSSETVAQGRLRLLSAIVGKSEQQQQMAAMIWVHVGEIKAPLASPHLP